MQAFRLESTTIPLKPTVKVTGSITLSPNAEDKPLDLSLKTQRTVRNRPTPLSRPNNLPSGRSAYGNVEKTRPLLRNGIQPTVTWTDWQIPQQQEPTSTARFKGKSKVEKEKPKKFDKVAAHLHYNAAIEGMHKAAEHLTNFSGKSYEAFVKAAYSYDQAAVSSGSLGHLHDAQEFLFKASAARTVAIMAKDLGILEQIVAQGFERDAVKMENRCKLHEMLQTQKKLQPPAQSEFIQKMETESDCEIVRVQQSRKRLLDDLHLSDDDSDTNPPHLKKMMEESEDFTLIDTATGKPIEANGICRLETLAEKRARIEEEYSKIGIPQMTFSGPSAASVQPNSGTSRVFEYTKDFVPFRVTEKFMTFRGEESIPMTEQYYVFKEYQDWYRRALAELFPNTMLDPRILETFYGAKVKLLEYFTGGPVESQ